MNKISIDISGNSSKEIKNTHLIISVKTIRDNSSMIVVGYPGMKNTIKNMEIGDTLLFETPEDGIYEVRVMTILYNSVTLLISQISPKIGLMGGYVTDDPLNSNFTNDEKSKIKESIQNTKNNLSKNQNISKEKLDLIYKKLDDIQNASERLGRKDWINYVAGSLTSLSISASFSNETRIFLFQTLNTSFEWLFNNAMRLIT